MWAIPITVLLICATCVIIAGMFLVTRREELDKGVSEYRASLDVVAQRQVLLEKHMEELHKDVKSIVLKSGIQSLQAGFRP